MRYPLDNPREEDPPVPVGPYYFETLNNSERINQLLRFSSCAIKTGCLDLDFRSRPDKEPGPEGIRIILSSGNKVPVSGPAPGPNQGLDYALAP